MALVGFGVLLLQLSHVFGDVSTEDVFAEDVGLEFLSLSVVSNETGHGVGDVKTTISRSLHCGEDFATSAGSSKTNIQEAFEWAVLALDGGDGVILSVDVLVALVLGVQLELLQHSAGSQQSGGVGC